MQTLTIYNTPETPLALIVEQAQNNRVRGNDDEGPPFKGPPFTRAEARRVLANLALQPDPAVRALFRGLHDSLKAAE